MNKLSTLISHGLCISLWFFTGCSSEDEPKPVDCTKSDLDVELVTKTNPTSCTSNDGSITVAGLGGKEPYLYAINGGSFSSSATFNNLGGGTFEVQIKDKNGCEESMNVSLIITGENPLAATLVTTSDTECVSNNGTIQVNASGGVGPYQYRIGTGTFGDASSFGNLAPGSYSISVQDSEGCIFTVGATVGKGDTGTKLSTDIVPIIESKCAVSNCHNGTQSPDLRNSSNIISNAPAIKSLTQSGSMPKNGTLNSSQKALIACWVDDGAKNN